VNQSLYETAALINQFVKAHKNGGFSEGALTAGQKMQIDAKLHELEIIQAEVKTSIQQTISEHKSGVIKRHARRKMLFLQEQGQPVSAQSVTNKKSRQKQKKPFQQRLAKRFDHLSAALLEIRNAQDTATVEEALANAEKLLKKYRRTVARKGAVVLPKNAEALPAKLTHLSIPLTIIFAKTDG